MFDPTKPANTSPISSAELRNQFNGLKDLIDAVPAGPPGVGIVNIHDDGTGRAIIELSDGTSYGPYTIANGPPGANGADGAPGPQGPPGADGEVTYNYLSTQLYNYVRKPSSLDYLTGGVSDPPTQAEVQAMYDKINAIIAVLTSP
jgi:hypothetical protein